MHLFIFLLAQGPSGNFGLKGVPGPKGPVGTLVSLFYRYGWQNGHPKNNV